MEESLDLQIIETEQILDHYVRRFDITRKMSYYIHKYIPFLFISHLIISIIQVVILGKTEGTDKMPLSFAISIIFVVILGIVMWKVKNKLEIRRRKKERDIIGEFIDEDFYYFYILKEYEYEMCMIYIAVGFPISRNLFLLPCQILFLISALSILLRNRYSLKSLQHSVTLHRLEQKIKKKEKN